MRLLAAGLVLGSLLPAFAGTLTVAVSRTPLSLPVYVAQAANLFAEEGVTVKINDCIGGLRCLKQMLEGAADVSTAADAPVMFQSFLSADFAVICTFATNSDDAKLISRKSSGVLRPADLARRKVGIVRGSSSQYYLDVYLLLHGIDPQTVEIVNLLPEDMPAALLSGKVDALSVWEPYGYQAFNALKGDALQLPSDDVYNVMFNLVAHRRVTGSRDADLTRMLRALSRAEKLIREQPSRAQAILSAKLGVDQRFIDWVWPGLRYRLMLDQALIKTLESQARWAVREGHVSSRDIPNYLAYLYAAPLRAVDADAVGIVK